MARHFDRSVVDVEESPIMVARGLPGAVWSDEGGDTPAAMSWVIGPMVTSLLYRLVSSRNEITAGPFA